MGRPAARLETMVLNARMSWYVLYAKGDDFPYMGDIS